MFWTALLCCSIFQGSSGTNWLRNFSVRHRYWSPRWAEEEGQHGHFPVLKLATTLTLDSSSLQSEFANLMANALDMFFDDWVEVGGLLMLDGQRHVVELIIYDDSYDPEAVEELTKYLIEVEGVRHFFSPYTSYLASAMATLVHEAGGLMIAPGASLQTIFKDRPLLFTVAPSLEYMFKGSLEVLSQQGDGDQAGGPKTIMAITEDNEWGRTGCSAALDSAQELGISVLSEMIVISDTASDDDIEEVVSQLADKEPELVITCTYHPMCHRLLREMGASRFSPFALVATICVSGSEFYAETGRTGNFVSGLAPWIPTSTKSGPLTGNMTGQSFAARFYEKYGVVPPYQAAHAYTAAATMMAALTAVGESDPAALAEYLHAMDNQSFMGRITFDSEGMRVPDDFLIQQQNDEIVLIESVADQGRKTMVYPKPNWTMMDCIDLDPTYMSNYGLYHEACVLCPLGYHANSLLENASFRYCLQCPVGRTGIDVAATRTCVSCGSGTYSSTPGATMCQACKAGTYRSSAGGSVCDACPIGSFSEFSGSSSCRACGAGRYSNATKQSACKKCPIGTFRRDDQDPTTCWECEAGYITEEEGSTVCTACTAGRYATQAHDQCVECPKGQYCAVKGCTACLDCPLDSTSSRIGSDCVDDCSLCKDGLVFSNHSCISCPFGRVPTADSQACEVSTNMVIGSVILLAGVVCGSLIVYCFLQAYRRRLLGFQAKSESIVEEKIRQGLNTTAEFGHPMILICASKFSKLRYDELQGLHEASRDNGRLLYIDSVETCNKLKEDGLHTIFLSYQWLSWSRKGASELQFQAMKLAVTQVIAHHRWYPSRTFVWLDILSIPQAHPAVQTLAVDSLFIYSKCSDVLVCVCPSSRHEDTNEVVNRASYERRLWCRVELLAHCCTHGVKGVYMCDDKGLRQVSRNWAQSVVRVFRGDLTCCRKGHKGGTVPCDRESLVLTLLGLYFECSAARGSSPGLEFFREATYCQKDAMFPKDFEYTIGSQDASDIVRTERRELFGDLIQRIDARLVNPAESSWSLSALPNAPRSLSGWAPSQEEISSQVTTATGLSKSAKSKSFEDEDITSPNTSRPRALSDQSDRNVDFENENEAATSVPVRFPDSAPVVVVPDKEESADDNAASPLPLLFPKASL